LWLQGQDLQNQPQQADHATDDSSSFGALSRVSRLLTFIVLLLVRCVKC
jgi:hypothetical protein